jgi:hypothetical protein
MKSASGKRDAAVREFERRDAGADIASSGTSVVVHPERTPSDIMDELTAETERLGLYDD